MGSRPDNVFPMSVLCTNRKNQCTYPKWMMSVLQRALYFSNKVKLSKQDLQKFANAYSLHFVLMMNTRDELLTELFCGRTFKVKVKWCQSVVYRMLPVVSTTVIGANEPMLLSNTATPLGGPFFSLSHCRSLQ